MEQPLPPYAACMLGSLNLVKYCREIYSQGGTGPVGFIFDQNKFVADIYWIVKGMDNVIDQTVYPLPQQEAEQKNKRRMGLGVTGLANAMEMCGTQYGTPEGLVFTEKVMELLRDTAYRASIELAKERGAFPLYDATLYNNGAFIKTLPRDIRKDLEKYGIRNSHLLSIAPTGTISLTADNVSSGIEPPFSLEYVRDVFLEDGEQRTYTVKDYAWNFHGIRGVTADEISAQDHVDILNVCSRYVDSSCSKTCNVGDDVTFEEFKEIYMRAYEGGAKGCTTFRSAGKRFGVLRSIEDAPKEEEEGSACYFDVTTGEKSCA